MNGHSLQLSRKQEMGERDRLVGRASFGTDSLVESLAGVILLWRFAAARASSEAAERRAQKLIGLSFYVIAAYVAFEAVRSLVVGARPEASWIGIVLAALTLVTMPTLAIAKARVGAKQDDCCS